MDIRQIEYFIAVADSLSFTKASEILYVSQPALSKQVSSLEEELGVTLLERTKRSVLLTPAGALFLQKAKELLLHKDSIVAMTRATVDPTHGELYLNIGIEKSALSCPQLLCLLQEAVFRMKQRYTFMRTHFCVIPEDESNIRLSQISDTSRSAPDICLAKHGRIHGDDQFGFHCIIRHPLVVQLTSSEPYVDSREALEELCATRILYLDQYAPALIRQSVNLFKQLNISPHIVLLESPEVRNLIVGSGDGMTVVSSLYGGLPMSENVRTFHPDVPDKWLYTGLLWRLENLNPAIQLLIDSIAEIKHDFFDESDELA